MVIQGLTVTRGYEENSEANARSFVNGWFRTGDQGVLDEDGYLRLTGRLSELINRGGEKIAPREVDEVLSKYILVWRKPSLSASRTPLGGKRLPPQSFFGEQPKALRCCRIAGKD